MSKQPVPIKRDGRFAHEHITDGKRWARGLLIKETRRRLRVRDFVHHRKWQILTLAGLAPEGELGAIRSEMPKARIIAVDRDPACVAAAQSAGADVVVETDLTTPYDVERAALIPPRILHHAPFDVVMLDLCAGATRETKALVTAYLKRDVLSDGGILTLTFSYGRDVAEFFREKADRYEAALRRFSDAPLVIDDYPGRPPWSSIKTHLAPRTVREMAAFRDAREQGLSKEMIGRLAYLFDDLGRLDVVALYRGHEMPMCSVLLQRDRTTHPQNVRQTQIISYEPGDYELAVTSDPAVVFDCPQEYVEALRRKHAAIKAAYTQKRKRESAR